MKKPKVIQESTRRVWERIEQERVRKGVSWAEILRQLEVLGIKLNKNTAYDWKVGKSDSFLEYMGPLCEILEINADEVTFVDKSGSNIINSINESPNSTLNITENNLSKQEMELVEIYRNLSLKDQLDLVMYALKLKGEE